MSSSTESTRTVSRTDEEIQQLRQILTAAGYSILFLKEETKNSIVNGVKMPGSGGMLPLVQEISWASTPQDMALYAITVARETGCHEPHQSHVRLILKVALSFPF
jgi:hypothetical protein